MSALTPGDVEIDDAHDVTARAQRAEPVEQLHGEELTARGLR
jgi:hypothetical protein